MSRESVPVKAARLLAAGAVAVIEAGAGYCTAVVRGDSGVHEVLRRRGGWWCSCPCPGRCSHLAAVQLVADPRLSPDRPTITTDPRSTR